MEIVNQVQEAQRAPYRINPRRNTLRHILTKLTKTKYKERILKVAREKQQVTQWKPHKLNSWRSFSRDSAGQKGMAGYIWSIEREKSTIKITVPGKDLNQIWWRNQKLFRKAKVKRIQYHQTSFTTNVQGTYIVMKYKRRKRSTKSTPNN